MAQQKTAIQKLIEYMEENFHLTEESRHEFKKALEGEDAPLQPQGWVSVNDALPEPLETVWLTSGEGWCCLGCLVESDGGWHWAQSNGVIYIEDGEIVSQCESEDLTVNFWHKLPKAPCLQPIHTSQPKPLQKG
jgi:hypothetical protein